MGEIKLSHPGIIQLMGLDFAGSCSVSVFGVIFRLEKVSPFCFLYQWDFEPSQGKAIKMPAKLFQGC